MSEPNGKTPEEKLGEFRQELRGLAAKWVRLSRRDEERPGKVKGGRAGRVKTLDRCARDLREVERRKEWI